MLFSIGLRDLEFWGYHGCFKEENIVGNPYLVNVKLYTSDFTPCKTDKICDAINYQEVYTIIKDEMAINSALIAPLALRIMGCLFDQFGQIEQISLEIRKVNPSIAGVVGGSETEMNLSRTQFERIR